MTISHQVTIVVIASIGNLSRFGDFSLTGIFAPSESSRWELSLPMNRMNESSWELSLPGSFVLGTFVPGSECSRERTVQVTTISYT